MHKLLRRVMILLLAAFAGGLVMQSVAASAMAFDMAAGHSEPMAMDSCDGCDDTALQPGDMACDIACDTVLAATLPEAVPLSLPQSEKPHDVRHEALIGYTPPLGRDPPRTTFLI